MRKPVATSVRSAVLVARARVGSVCVGTGLARRHVALLAAAGSRRPATAAERLRAAADALPADARPDRIDGGDVVEGFERRALISWVKMPRRCRRA